LRFSRLGVALSVLALSGAMVSGCGETAPKSAPRSSTSASPVQSNCGGKKTLTASGSTAQAKAMTRFVDAFEEACPGHTLNYSAKSSATGITEFTSKKTDFGGSDEPLDQAQGDAARQRCGSPAWNLPLVFAPIAIVYNVKGLDSLTLDAPTAAKIFNATITAWNDPAIQALNPGATLPTEPIHLIFRKDDSWTTNSFQQYLDVASGGAWGKGAGRKFNGGKGDSAKGNDGTAAAVKGTDSSIGYTSWSSSKSQTLDMAKLVTSAGPDAVGITADSAAKTVAGAAFSGQGNDLVLDTRSFEKPSMPGSYPILLPAYEIVCSKYPDADVGASVRMFLQTAIGAGQKGLADNGNVPLPDEFKSKLSAAVNAIT
ncbi:ABC-type phosphate transport system, periplasmic component, partial [Mycobacterium rhizamassiliense]